MAQNGLPARRAITALLVALSLLAVGGLTLGRPAWAAGGEPTPTEVAARRLDRRLRALVRSAPSLVGEREVYVLIKSQSELALDHLASDAVSTRWPLGQWVTLARVRVDRLVKLATLPGVEVVEDAVHPEPATDEVVPPGIQRRTDRAGQLARLAALKAAEVPYAAAPVLAARKQAGLERPTKNGRGATNSLTAWHDVAVAHGSAKAWALGWRGEGVRVGVADSGVDFATPELIGTWATIEDQGSPYYRWPQALDAQGLYLLVQDVQLGSDFTTLGAGGLVSVTQRANATRDFDGVRGGYGKACFQRVLYGNVREEALTCDYRVPWQSASGVYRFAVHPDPSLVSLYRERPGVLLVDRARANVYDTVYVDLDNDHDFTDEKPVTRDDPLVVRDMDGDGWPDLSGGLLYWISDGQNLPPGAYLWPGLVPKPKQGDLVAFIGPWSGSHGTSCASNVVGQGVVPVPEGVRLRFRDLPGNGQPKPLHVGAAPGAKLVAIHRGGLLVTESAYIYAAYGHEPDRQGDELQILSNSYGFNDVQNEGWDNTSRLIDYLATVNPTLSYLFSSGNGGPGYGSIRAPNPKSALKVAASSQTGSTGYDSITETRQIVWGDVASFSSSGPAADGTIGPLVAADGAYASGATILNGRLDGRQTIVTWGGTSRSTPVAAGNLALVYQAFAAHHGRWPTAEEARSLLMAGASPLGYDPLTVGAGVIDGGRSAAIAGGRDGLMALPPVLLPGDYRGTAYAAFPRLMARGQPTTMELTLVNPSGRAITATLRAVEPRRVASTSFTWTSQPVRQETASFAGVPDYLIPVSLAWLPEDTQLLAVRLVWPIERSDVGLDYTYGGNDNAWYLRVYQHTDIDGDGQLWTDRDGDGVVDKRVLTTSHQLDGIADVDWAQTEVDRWEFARLGQDVRPNNNAVVWVHSPWQRQADGLYIGLQHATRPTSVPTTTLTFRLDAFRYQPWDWVTFEPERLTVPAESSSTVRLRLTPPGDAPLGYTQGYVMVAYDWQAPEPTVWPPAWPARLYLPRLDNRATVGSDARALSYLDRSPTASAVPETTTLRELAVPVLANVAAELGPDSVTLVPESATGAAHDADLPYPNGLVRGANRWNYGPESGDLRYYFVDVTDPTVSGGQFVLHASWLDGLAHTTAGATSPRSDIDVRVFGPAADRWSDPRHPENARENLADPLRFGPYTTVMVGSSVHQNTRAGVWQFETATGGYEDWVTAPLTAGLHVVQAHNTLIAGDRFDVPLSLALERAWIHPPRVTGRGPGGQCLLVSLTTTFALPALSVAGYGLSATEEFASQTVHQDQADNVLTASWRHRFQVRHGSRIEIRLDGGASDDLDLFLYLDRDGDGQPTSEEQVASATTSEADERIDYLWPVDGTYLVTVHGWKVPSGEARFDLQLTAIQGEGIRVSGLDPGPYAAGKPIGFQLCYDLPPAAPAKVQRGELYLGPSRVPRLFRIPVEVTL